MAEANDYEQKLQQRWTAASFNLQEMPVTDGTQYVRAGGKGPAILLLHGFGDTGDMWISLAERLVKDRTVVVPDLRGHTMARRHPVILAVIARHVVTGAAEGARAGYRTHRSLR